MTSSSADSHPHPSRHHVPGDPTTVARLRATLADWLTPDHIGWYEQGDGKLFLGINIETGRIKDDGPLRIKTGLRKILETYGMPTRLTALQSSGGAWRRGF